MKKLLVFICICAVFLSACSAADTFYYDSSNFSVYYEDIIISREPPASTFEELESLYRSLRGAEYNESVFILVAEIAGPSVNRIIEPEDPDDWDPTVVYGSNHVITPMRIKEVIYQSDGNDLKAGDEINMMERYFIATKETPLLLEEVGRNTVITNSQYPYTPMERGKTYVIYAGINAWNKDSPYLYNGEPPYVANSNAVYCISEEPVNERQTEDSVYMDMWNSVMKAYGDKVGG
jgi:hypothetical protein